jgi:hypothetical protein
MALLGESVLNEPHDFQTPAAGPAGRQLCNWFKQEPCDVSCVTGVVMACYGAYSVYW